MKTYIPKAGESIKAACIEAVSRSKLRAAPVTFSFNNIAIEALPDSIPSELEQGYFARMEADRVAYEKSPNGIAARIQREEEIIRQQGAIDRLLFQFLKDKSLDEMMEWLLELTKNGDDVGVYFDKQNLFSRLEGAGYKENEGVGQAPEWFNTRERMGRYIIGQAMNCLHLGMPPHPITLSFIDKYLSLP